MDGVRGTRGGGGRAYTRPEIVDYGDLLEITSASPLLFAVGIHDHSAGAANSSIPVAPPGGGPGPHHVVQSGHHGDVLGATDTGGGNDLTGGNGGGGGGDAGGVAGQNAAGGGGSHGGGGHGGGSGGGGGSLPFTGFPAAVAGAVGAAMTSAGVALRRWVRSRD